MVQEAQPHHSLPDHDSRLPGCRDDLWVSLNSFCIRSGDQKVKHISGYRYDSSMVNGLQAIAGWQEYFNHPDGSILGILSAAYSLGTVLALPFVPFVTDRLGRKLPIVIGSIIMVIGAILQTATQNSPSIISDHWRFC